MLVYQRVHVPSQVPTTRRLVVQVSGLSPADEALLCRRPAAMRAKRPGVVNLALSWLDQNNIYGILMGFNGILWDFNGIYGFMKNIYMNIKI